MNTDSGQLSSVVSGDLRCVNCGLNLSRMQRHTLKVAEVRCLIQRWVGLHQVQVSSNSLVCHTCWTNAWNEIWHPTSPEPIVGHVRVCISCGTSLLRKRSHRLNTETAREAAISNMVIQKIAPRQLPKTALLCHNCWRRTDRATSQFNVKQELETRNSPSGESEELKPTATSSDEESTVDISDRATSQFNVKQELETRNSPSGESAELKPTAISSQEESTVDISDRNEILLPNYFRAPSTQRQCFYPRCNGTERILVPSSLRISLLCDYNYYVPPDCRICLYHLNSNSWKLLLESMYNPIRTFSSEQIEELLGLLKDNIRKCI